ncbi:MAG: hypothetical protein K2K57_07950 [Oscillospiraceae bacterium]|nr:hypothetical protein [Oscillospiraceae bacterium]
MKKSKLLAAALAAVMTVSLGGSVYASPWGGGQDVSKPNSVIDVEENASDNPQGGSSSENRLVQGSEPVSIIKPSEKHEPITSTEAPVTEPRTETTLWFDSEKIVTSESKKKSPTDFVDSSKALYSYSEMCEDIKGLQEVYGDIIKVQAIGTTADRRKIYDIIIGDIGADKQMIVQASCHGREYMTSLLVMEQLEYALNNYDSVVYGGRTARECFKGIEVHIIPMLNPDGVSISQYGKSGIKNPVMRLNLSSIYKNNVKWRYTNLSETNYYRRWKANGKGVDINRNFDGRWKYVDEINGTSSQFYKGRQAESESETKALCDLTRSLSNPVTAVSYHATGSVIWWDYGQTGEFARRCESMARTVRSVTGYDFVPRDPDSAGGYCDWIIENGGGKTVPILIEIGKNQCPLGIAEYPDIWSRNKNVLFAAAVNS